MGQLPPDNTFPEDDFRTTDPEHAAEPGRRGWLIALAVLLTGAVVGLAVWFAVGRDGDSPAESVNPTSSTTPSADPTVTTEPSAQPSDTPSDPTADGEAPTVEAGAFTPNEIHDEANTLNCAESAEVAVTATDNVGVTAVSAQADVAGVTVTETEASGDMWTFTAQASGLEAQSTNDVTVTFTAQDAAGNSSTATASLRVFGDGMCAD